MKYKKMGFKAGLEIHQQIEGHKLFCKCPTIIRNDKPDIIIKRELNASAGETGKIDVAAKFEQERGKYFIYHAYSDTNCLLELDSQPPDEINKDALKIAFQVAMLLRARLINNIQVMRKVVIDGSNTSGFQRTMLIGIDGEIETSQGKVSIPTICLEEEAAKAEERNKDYVVYNLSRLGIPLIEIATGTEIKNPEHAKETAQKIGMILRSVEGIKRGLGSIRQDVNVSIKKGARVEIKGFQDYRNIAKVINNEIKRQLDAKGKLKEEVRKAEPDFTTSFLRPMPGAERMYPETDVPLIKIDNKFLKSIVLPELMSEKAEKLEEEGINPDLARELVKKKINIHKYDFNLNKNLIAKTLIETPKEIKKRFNLDVKERDILEVLKCIEDKKLSEDNIVDALLEKTKTGKIDFKRYKKADLKDVEKEIDKIINKHKDASFNAIMGIAMGKFKGKVEGKKLAELIKKKI